MNSRLEVIDIAASRATPALCDAVFQSLRQPEKSLPCRFFYDDAGSELFERITQLPEYYLTRCEAEILECRADEIVDSVASPCALVEFGSGSSAKTRTLIEAVLRRQPSLSYTPIDISRDFLIKSSDELLSEYPGLSVTAIASEYLDAVANLPDAETPRLFLFLGSNIGNFTNDEAIAFLTAVSAALKPGDRVLLGADLVKDATVLFDAYNDSEGVTAEFNLNLLRRINRDLNANFDVDRFEHSAPFVDESSRIEMRLIAKESHSIYIEDLDTEFGFESGEVVTTEFSHKYTVEAIQDLVSTSGLSVDRQWTDSNGYFGEFLLRPNAVARKSQLKERLSEVRNRTLRLLSYVSDDFLRRRVHEFYSPIGWHFGHVGRTEEFWVCNALGTEPSNPELSFIYADLQDNPKDNRVNIPDRAGTIDYLAQTREFALDALDKADLESTDPLITDGYAWEFAIQHECQHHETIAEMLHLIQQKLEPTSIEPTAIEPLPWRSEIRSRMIEHSGGPFEMGDGNIHGYDNEKDPHVVTVEPFVLAEYPVTCLEWSQFISDGGYQRKDVWSQAGWAWKESSLTIAPSYWLKFGEAHAQFGPFGLRALHPDEPVMGVSHHEAEAYASWKGLRLPTEAEWEYAASLAGSDTKRKFAWGDAEPSPLHACHSLHEWSPRPVGQAPLGRTPLGVSDLAGNVWEWTGTPFLAYPGFRAFPYDGYSKDHMFGAHFVCRGGSWATSPVILRNTFRNWYVPGYRQGFLGVRLAGG